MSAIKGSINWLVGNMHQPGQVLKARLHWHSYSQVLNRRTCVLKQRIRLMRVLHMHIVCRACFTLELNCVSRILVRLPRTRPHWWNSFSIFNACHTHTHGAKHSM